MYLNAHSYFSLRYGTMSPEKLIDIAIENNVEFLALTDINNSSAMFDFIRLCREKGIRPVCGIEFRNGNKCCFTGLAKNKTGMRELNEYLSRHLIEKKEFPAQAPHLEHCYFVYPAGAISSELLEDQEYIGIKHTEINKIISGKLHPFRHKLLIFQSLTFADKSQYHQHRLLRAIEQNSLISKLNPEDCASPDELIMPLSQLISHYANFPDIIANTQRIADNCQIDIDLKGNKNKKSFTGSPADDRELLRKLAFDGLGSRYGKWHKEAIQRLNKELEIIDKLDFCAYFLITRDIVRYAQSRNFYYVGRGSGANSITAYCLYITNVDPIELDLYFERFINPQRSSPPDFDIDFAWNERNDVIDYIFKRYGKKHTALLGSYVTFQGKSIIRELGKVFGLPKNEIDTLIDQADNTIHQNRITEAIFKYGKALEKQPNYLSIHAGGILISEEPINSYTALHMPPKGFQTTQFDMHVAEEAGLYKYDILSQRGIGHINDCIRLLAEKKGIKTDIHQIDVLKKDKKLRKLLKSGHTLGCFYIESPAMRALLGKLRCEDYKSLVDASSIIRPGVAKSGMMREYIRRFHDPDNFEYLHPDLKELLKNTFGIMIYQEDVIKVAHYFAGLSLADADTLRRAMSGKFRSKTEFMRIADVFFHNCREKGYDEEIIKELWRQIESFSGYSFSKAHSASYAVESFQSLYLKAYHPLEFMVAVINNFGGFYRTEIYVNEARRWGANIEAPCINKSENLSTIFGKNIYLGFIHVQQLEKKAVDCLLEERQKSGPYRDLEDFTCRVGISMEQLSLLIRVGAFRFSGQSKQVLMWEAHKLLNKNRKSIQGNSLFHIAAKKYDLPALDSDPLEDAFDEIELIGFPLCSPFYLLEKAPGNNVRATDLLQNNNKNVAITGYLVCIKYVRTVKGDLMNFATFLDIHGDFFDSIHFPDVLKQFPFRGKGLYFIKGRVSVDFNHPSIEVSFMEKSALKKASGED
jgi:error-prone DNA polymerase